MTIGKETIPLEGWRGLYRTFLHTRLTGGTSAEGYIIALKANLKQGHTMYSDDCVQNWGVHVIRLNDDELMQVRNPDISERTVERIIKRFHQRQNSEK